MYKLKRNDEVICGVGKSCLHNGSLEFESNNKFSCSFKHQN